jgi:PPP family 3-phenylpropionic acid transporter
LLQAGLSASAVTLFLALTRVVRVVSTPLWTALVDARSSARDVLLWTSVPTAAFFAWMGATRPGWSWFAAFVLFVVLRGPSVSLCDVLALDAAARAQTPYGKLRLWGTVGYCAGAFIAGALHQRHASRAVLWLSFAVTLVGAVSVWRLPRVQAPRREGILRGLRALLSNRRYVLLLVCAALHQIGLGAYDMLYAPWAASRTSGTIAGLSIAVGGVAEVLFMLWGGPALRALGTHRALALAFSVSAVRWWLLARWTSPVAIVGLQLAHALTFGAFYLAAIELVEREAPAEVRASAQGLFTTVTFGIAAALGLVIAAPLQRVGGLGLVFEVASGCALLASVIALFGLKISPRSEAARTPPGT